MATAAQYLQELAEHQPEWAKTTPEEKAAVAKEILAILNTDEWVKADYWFEEDVKVTQIDPFAPSGADQLAGNRYLFASAFKDFLDLVIRLASPPPKGSLPTVKRRVNETTMAYGPSPIGPVPGITFELWCTQKEGEEGQETVKPLERAPAVDASSGKVTVVLGAGNQSMLGAVDALNCVFLDGECVLFKHHPLKPHLAAPMQTLFAPLIARGVYRQVVDSGRQAATELCCHPLVRRVHLTGSQATAQAVEAAMKAAKKEKSVVTSEAGGASPWILTPGRYTPVELTHAARLIVTAKKNNGGCNCISAQVVVLAAGWAQKEDFLTALRAELQRQPTCPSWYPNARTRRRKLFQHYAALSPVRAEAARTKRVQPGDPPPPLEHVLKLGGGAGDSEDDHPCLLFCGQYGTKDYDGTAVQTEAFCPALAIVELPGGEEAGAGYLLDVAVPFVNSDAVFGSLACSVVAPKAVQTEEVEAAVGKLQYGCVGVNTWAVWAFPAMVNGGAIWGAHRTDSEKKGESGRGVCGNAWRLRNPEKTVLRVGPLSTPPAIDHAKPPPGIVMDAIVAGRTSQSFMEGFVRVMRVLLSRACQSVLSTLGIGRGRMLYGAAGRGVL
mmetsp:Transcript_26702/g.63495  ORF Transcript_26702/g.63495 Transcript_26702/m.63495 type:complete len:611 (+) Transcript_26702:167-1999(+)